MRKVNVLIVTFIFSALMSLPVLGQTKDLLQKDSPRSSKESIKNSAYLYNAHDLATAGAEVFYSVMQMPGIKQTVLDQAYAIAVFPSKLKFGSPMESNKYGGVASFRDQQTGQWEPPVFFNITGGNISEKLEGENNIILIALNPRAASAFLSGNLKRGRILIPRDPVY